MNQADKIYSNVPAGDVRLFELPRTQAIVFNCGGREVMTLRRDSIEVSPDIEVPDAAKAIFDALESMITSAWGKPRKD